MAAAAGSEVVGTARFEYRSDHGTLHMRELMASLRDDRGGSPPFKAFTDFPVFNARLAGAELDSHGFCLLPHASREAWRADRYAVADRYAEEVCELLQQATGADHVFRANPQPVIRVESAVAGQAGPALFVHSDFTHDHKDALVAAVEALQSNPDRPNVRNVVAQQIEATGLTAADVRESRVVMLNTWRPVMEEPLQRYPLAVADCRTVKDGEVLGARSGCIHSTEHKWYIYPEQTKDELLLFVGFDSAAAPGFTPTVHSSFDLGEGASEGAAPRVSADMRWCLLFTGAGADSRPLMRRHKL